MYLQRRYFCYKFSKRAWISMIAFFTYFCLNKLCTDLQIRGSLKIYSNINNNL